MKIFAAGDFHGTVPKKFKKIVQSCDFMLCTGDLANRDEERKFYFKNWKKLTKVDVFDVISKAKFAKMLTRGIKSMIPVVNEIDSWDIPCVMINGNGDFTRQRIKELAMGVKLPKGLLRLETLAKQSKHVNFFPNSVVDFDDKYQIITWYGGSGIPVEFDIPLLKELFSQKIPRKKIIFLTHEPPYRCKLDVAEMGPLKGKHIGDKAVKWAIKKYKPVLNISGHIHGGQGKTKIGDTICVNAGYGRKGQAAVIELDKKIKVEFI